MYEVSKCAPQESLRDLDRAFKNFFRLLKSGKRTGFPRFKKKGIHDSFRLTGSIHVSQGQVVLPRIGRVRTKEETALGGHILSVTVSREADRWFASFSVKRKRGEYNRTVQDPAIGVDVGIRSFCVLSDFLHKLSTQLAKTKSVVVVEDLNVRGMMQNHHLSRHIADSGWSQFFTMLSYKTKWYGSSLIKAPKFYPSSKTCCACGSIKPELSLKERQFVCEICGFTIDRDENAARNLEYLSTPLDSKHLTGSTGSSPGSYACGDTSGGGTR